MIRFCETCRHLLTTVETSDELFFVCDKCSQKSNATPLDTLRYHNVKGGNITQYNTVLRHAHNDPVNPKVIRKCPKCPSKYARQVRLMGNLRLINACIACKHQWPEAST